MRLFARLHEALKQARSAQGAWLATADEVPPLADGTPLAHCLESYDDNLLEGLRDVAWPVRSAAVGSLSAMVGVTVDEDQPLLLMDALGALFDASSAQKQNAVHVAGVPKFAIPENIRIHSGAPGRPGAVLILGQRSTASK